jgi:hypothetical protein
MLFAESRSTRLQSQPTRSSTTARLDPSTRSSTKRYFNQTPAETKMAAASTPNSSKAISLKLLVNSNSRKVLFAGAGKEFVDFLFGLMQIPIGSIMGLLLESWHGWAWIVEFRVYESIQNLDPTCLHQTKEELLMPEPAFPSNTHPPPLLLNFVPPNQATTSVENHFNSRSLSNSCDLVGG